MADPTFFGERLLIGKLYSADVEKANNSSTRDGPADPGQSRAQGPVLARGLLWLSRSVSSVIVCTGQSRAPLLCLRIIGPTSSCTCIDQRASRAWLF